VGHSLRRYTELPFVIEYLQTKKLVLLDPSSWDDKNDSYFIKQYMKDKKSLSTAALCLTECKETYHHWSIFSNGTSGVCIEFNKDEFNKNIEGIDNLRAEKVRYKTISALRSSPPCSDELPFLKRIAFDSESEFRLFWDSKEPNRSIFKINMPLSVIQRIILSPWLPKSVAEYVKCTLKSIPECADIPIHSSTLVENEDWKKLSHINNEVLELV